MTLQTTSIDPATLSSRDAYRLLISVIIPRPIAWVSTIGAAGTLNLAPFSFFNGVSGSPPTVVISVGERNDQPKDTLRNVQEVGELVVNLADRTLAEAMVKTSGEWAYEVDEFEMAGLTTAPSMVVKPPRVAQAPIAMEVKASQLVPVEGTDNTLIIGRVAYFHIREDLLLAKGTVDPRRFDPVARLGSADYATLGQVFTILRPQI